MEKDDIRPQTSEYGGSGSSRHTLPLLSKSDTKALHEIM